MNIVIHYLTEHYDLMPTDLFSRFGKPDLAETSSVQNKHTDEQDFVYEYRFDDVSITIYHATGINRHFLQELETDNMAQFSNVGIVPEMPPDSLRSLLGPESTAFGDEASIRQLHYEVGDETLHQVSFFFRQNKLVSISYQPYLD